MVVRENAGRGEGIETPSSFQFAVIRFQSKKEGDKYLLIFGLRAFEEVRFICNNKNHPRMNGGGLFFEVFRNRWFADC